MLNRPAGWCPAPYKPPMLSNSRAQLGLAPAVVAVPLAWRLVTNFGIPLLISAGIIAASSTALKTAVPSIPINTEKIGVAALTGGIGVAGYYLGDLLPEKWRPAAYVVAVAGVATSVYFLFSKPEVPGTGTFTVDEPSPGQGIPRLPNGQPLPPGWMAQQMRVVIDPKEARDSRSVFISQDYEFSIWNKSGHPVTSFAGLYLTGEGIEMVYRTPKEERLPITVETLPSGKVPEVQKMTIPMKWTGEQAVPTGDFGLTVELYEKRSDSNPALVSASVPISYWIFG